jgi:hypothetical protein
MFMMLGFRLLSLYLFENLHKDSDFVIIIG